MRRSIDTVCGSLYCAVVIRNTVTTDNGVQKHYLKAYSSDLGILSINIFTTFR
jgi:hypothetical protein